MNMNDTRNAKIEIYLGKTLNFARSKSDKTNKIKIDKTCVSAIIRLNVIEQL